MQSLQDVANNLPIAKINDTSALMEYLSKRIAIYRLYSGGVFVIRVNGIGIADFPELAGRRHADVNDLEFF